VENVESDLSSVHRERISLVSEPDIALSVPNAQLRGTLLVVKLPSRKMVVQKTA
jgi:hypothetical protein